MVLRREQEFVKRAEKEMLTGADFTYVLKYLKKLNNLRGLENGFREYAMGELEIARSRLDSQKETATMIREDQAELEEKLIVLSQAMSEKLAYSEFVAETYMKDNIQTETDLQRLTEIMESYIEAEEDRAESGGGTAQAASLRHADLSRQTVRNLHGKMQEYRNMRDEHDEQLRERARGHVAEIDRLEKHLLELEHKLEYTTRDLVFHRARADAAEEDVKFCAKKMMKMAINKQFGVQESWAFGLRRALLVTDYERKMSEAKILCKAALQESDNPLVVLMAQGINDIFQLISPDDQRELNEIESMTKADAFSLKLRRYLKEREQMSKGKPKKAGNKDDGVDSKKSSKSKKGDDDDDDEDDEGGKDSKKTGKKSKKGKGGDKEKGDKKKKKKK